MEENGRLIFDVGSHTEFFLLEGMSFEEWSNGKWSSNREEVNKEINKFLDDHNFKSYYTRVWEENGRLVFDVGSHTEFFILEGMSFEEWSNGK